MYIFDKDALREIMDENKITQRDLADSISVTYCTMSHYMTGARTPGINVLFKIAEVLKISAYDLVVRL